MYFKPLVYKSHTYFSILKEIFIQLIGKLHDILKFTHEFTAPKNISFFEKFAQNKSMHFKSFIRNLGLKVFLHSNEKDSISCSLIIGDRSWTRLDVVRPPISESWHFRGTSHAGIISDQQLSDDSKSQIIFHPHPSELHRFERNQNSCWQFFYQPISASI